MRIAFLARRELADPGAGGSEVLVDQLASGLHGRGHEVTVFCGGPVGARSYRTVSLGGPYAQFMLAPTLFARTIRSADLVVEVANGIVHYAPLWRSGPTVCLVNHVHREEWSMWFPRPVAFVGRTIETRVFPIAYRHRIVVAVSSSTADDLIQTGVRREQIRIVENGVSARTSMMMKSSTPLFLAVGRLVPQKRFDLLLDAWPTVRAATGGRLVIAGDGPELRRLSSAATDGVDIVGRVTNDERDTLLQQAWALVHPSQMEGWGLVIMEAAAAATPAIGFDVAGVRDSIANGVTGILVNTKAEFTQAMIDLASDGHQRERLAAAALARAGAFSWARTVSRFEVVAEEAVAVRSPVPGQLAAVAQPRP